MYRQASESLENHIDGMTMNQSPHSEVMKVLCDLIGFCKKRLDEPSLSDLSKVIPLDEQEDDLFYVAPHLLAEYVKQIIGYLMKSKVQLEQKLTHHSKPEDEYMNEYEGMLQKLEAECRQHIRIEQQLKICAETSQEKQELVEKDLLVSEALRRSLEDQLQASNHRNEEINLARKGLEVNINSLTQRMKEMEETVVAAAAAAQASTSTMHSHSASLLFSKSMKAPLPFAGSSNSSYSHFKQNAVTEPSEVSINHPKRSQRSISQMGQQVINPVPVSSSSSSSLLYREAMRQLENSGEFFNERLLTEQPVNIQVSDRPNSRLGQTPLQQIASGKKGNHNHSQSDSYPSQALAYLLGSSQIKPEKKTQQQFDEVKRKADRSGIEAKKKEDYILIECQQTSKTMNLSRGSSNSASINQKHSGNTSLTQSQSGGDSSVKRSKQQHKQQQLLKQVQSQAVLSKLQQKLSGTYQVPPQPQQQQILTSVPYINSNRSSAGCNTSSGHIISTQPSTSSTTVQSRSKSRLRFKEIHNESSFSKLKDYNIYMLQRVRKQQEENISEKEGSLIRTQSLDANQGQKNPQK